MGCTGSYIAAFVLGIEHVGYKVTIEIGMGCTGSYIAAFVLGIEHVGYKVTIEIGMFSSFSIYSFLVRYK